LNSEAIGCSVEFDDLTSVCLPALRAADNWQVQYRLLMNWGSLIRRKELLRCDANLLKGCEMPVWLAHSCVAGRHRFWFDSDSRVINGLVALVLSQVDNQTQADITQLDVRALLQELGLYKHLTPSRNNGFATIVQRVYELAAGE
jgi:cysteine desulfuration protein SufE